MEEEEEEKEKKKKKKEKKERKKRKKKPASPARCTLSQFWELHLKEPEQCTGLPRRKKEKEKKPSFY